MKVRGLVACGLVVASLGSHWQGVHASEESSPSGNLMIVGGNTVKQGQFPWTASVQVQSKHYCGGTLISEEWVMTAGHCVIHDSPNRVILGVANLDSKDGRVIRKVVKVVPHPKYFSTSKDNDIALIQLSSPVKNIRPIMLSGSATASIQQPGTDVLAAGYGATEQYGKSSNVLRAVVLPIVSYATCTAPGAYDPYLVPEKDSLCAGYKEGGKDSCGGDSGGPLFYDPSGQNDDAIQVGIVSWGSGCAQPNKYGVYTKVSSYIDWIQETLGKAKVQVYQDPSSKKTKTSKKKTHRKKHLRKSKTEEDAP